jgi:hypothetical protein
VPEFVGAFDVKSADCVQYSCRMDYFPHSWPREIWCHEDFSRKSHGTSTVSDADGKRGVKLQRKPRNWEESKANITIVLSLRRKALTRPTKQGGQECTTCSSSSLKPAHESITSGRPPMGSVRNMDSKDSVADMVWKGISAANPVLVHVK